MRACTQFNIAGILGITTDSDTIIEHFKPDAIRQRSSPFDYVLSCTIGNKLSYVVIRSPYRSS